ncbi:hypothetical protein AEGHOMDF_2078 [Methylobacterium soli]|nr:hypothetical protein AEGHOMDF_2078 [Methylobacterium soli]
MCVIETLTAFAKSSRPVLAPAPMRDGWHAARMSCRSDESHA